MGVNCTRDVLGAGAELHRQGCFGDEIRGARTEDVNAEDAIGLRVGEDLYATLGLIHAPRARVREERKRSDLELDLLTLRLLLGHADACKLRPGVDDVGDGVVVDVTRLPR